MNISIEDLHWSAGFIEGEGCFTMNKGYALVVLGQTEKEHIDRLVFLFGGSTNFREISKKNPRHKDAWIWSLHGQKAVDFMIMIRPLMGTRRRTRIDEIVEVWNSRPRLGRGRPPKQKAEISPKILKDNGRLNWLA